MAPINTDTETTTTLKINIFEYFIKTFSNYYEEFMDFLAESCFFDPRFKNYLFLEEELQVSLISRMKDLLVPEELEMDVEENNKNENIAPDIEH
jgi:hypothetical protein